MNIDTIVNVCFLIFFSGVAYCLICRERCSLASIVCTFIMGILSVTAGSTVIYLFHGTDSVLKQLMLEEVYINGQFIIIGYACFIALLISLLSKIIRSQA